MNIINMLIINMEKKLAGAIFFAGLMLQPGVLPSLFAQEGSSRITIQITRTVGGFSAVVTDSIGNPTTYPFSSCGEQTQPTTAAFLPDTSPEPNEQTYPISTGDPSDIEKRPAAPQAKPPVRSRFALSRFITEAIQEGYVSQKTVETVLENANGVWKEAREKMIDPDTGKPFPANHFASLGIQDINKFDTFTDLLAAFREALAKLDENPYDKESLKVLKFIGSFVTTVVAYQPAICDPEVCIGKTCKEGRANCVGFSLLFLHFTHMSELNVGLLGLQKGPAVLGTLEEHYANVYTALNGDTYVWDQGELRQFSDLLKDLGDAPFHYKSEINRMDDALSSWGMWWADKTMKESLAAAKNGNYDKALELAGSIEKKGPTYYKGLLNKKATAVSNWVKRLEIEKLRKETFGARDRALAALESKDYPKAITELNNAIKVAEEIKKRDPAYTMTVSRNGKERELTIDEWIEMIKLLKTQAAARK